MVSRDEGGGGALVVHGGAGTGRGGSLRNADSQATQDVAARGACLCNFTLWASGWQFIESETPLCSVPGALWELPQRLN